MRRVPPERKDACGGLSSGPMSEGAHGSAGRRAERLPALDWLKALAIVAVAMGHGGPFLMGPQATGFDHFVRGGLVLFHVPTFLVVSGFLYSRQSPQSLEAVGRRLSRFLVPYLMGSLVALALGFSAWRTPLDVLRHLAFGSAIGTYYYFFLLSVLVAAIWPLSRMSAPAVAWLLGALCAYAVASGLFPQLAVREDLYWYMRDPLHLAGYFLCGWLAAAWRAPLPRLERRWRPLLALAAALCVAAEVAALAGALPQGLRPFLRAGYTLSVVWAVCVLVARRPAPPLVRFLSDTTLTLYLYHQMIELALLPFAMPLAPPLRTLLLATAGLGGSTALLLASRRLLGRALTRRLLGS
jgi:fucose 4-O-acetylase-like acetyltransferase